jgi:hypothetical protein
MIIVTANVGLLASDASELGLWKQPFLMLRLCFHDNA